MGARIPAILGGQPAFNQPVLVGRPNVGDRQSLMDRLNDALDRRWLTNHGTYVRELEARLEETLGVSHCIAVCNATLGLQLAARALDLQGEVIVPSFTFIATAHAFSWIGLTPVFADIHPETCTLDPRDVEARITPRTTAICGVHVFGRACDIDGLAAVANFHRLTLMFDAAHAFRSSYKGHLIGSFGRCEVFSFHATKFFNSLEGGAISTDDPVLAARLRSMRDFGYAEDHVETLSTGTNAKMNEFAAAMGLTSLESLDLFVATNVKHYETYQQHLAGIPGVELLEYDRSELNNYQYIIVKVDGSRAGISRDDLSRALRAEHIVTRPYFHPPCHRMPPYGRLTDPANTTLLNSDRLAAQALALPTGTGVTHEEVVGICDSIRTVIAHAPQVRQQLAKAAA